jgi:hypothetical protein
MSFDPRLPPTPKLVVINTPGGARFSVAADYQAPFQGLVNDLEQGGYTIDPSHSGGYNPRFIAGTETPSQHAYGRAIDVNWNLNPRGGAGFNIPTDVAHTLAQKYGLTWGGDWSGSTRDPMHFEIAGHPAQTPVQDPTQEPTQEPAPGLIPRTAVPSPPGGNINDYVAQLQNNMQTQPSAQQQPRPVMPPGFGLGPQVSPEVTALTQVANAFRPKPNAATSFV